MAIGVGSPEHDAAVVIDHRQAPATIADLTAIGHVHGFRPKLLARFGVEPHRQPEIGRLDPVLGNLLGFAGEVDQIRLVLLEHLLALLGSERGIDEVNPAITDGDRDVGNVLALVTPAQFARPGVEGENHVRGVRDGPASTRTFGGEFLAVCGRAVKETVLSGDVSPLAFLRRPVAGNGEHTNRFASRGIELVALVLDHHEQGVVRGGHVARLIRSLQPIAHRTRVLDLPQLLAIVTVVGHHGLLALDKEAPIHRNRTHGSGVAVHHLAGTWISIPKDTETAFDPFIAVAGGVGRVAVLMGPVVGTRELRAGEASPAAVVCNGGLFGFKTRARKPLMDVFRGWSLQVLGRRLWQTEAELTADRLEVSSDGFRISRNHARFQQAVGDDQVGKIAAVGNDRQVEVIDGESRTVES